MPQDILVPDIGDFHDVEVIDVLVKAGDRVEVDTPLITIETEKATMDVPSTTAGTVKSVGIKKGDRVSQGGLILSIEAEGAAAASAASSKPEATVSAAPAPTSTSEQAITVPDIGDFKEVEVIDVLVKVGDSVQGDTPLITLETEKATMDVPSTTAGVVKSLAIKKGDRIGKGANILVLTVTSAAGVTASASAPAAATEATKPAPAAAATKPASPPPATAA